MMRFLVLKGLTLSDATAVSFSPRVMKWLIDSAMLEAHKDAFWIIGSSASVLSVAFLLCELFCSVRMINKETCNKKQKQMKIELKVELILGIKSV